MTHDNEAPVPQHRLGDVANGHILTGAGWLPLRRIPTGSPGPYYAGDLLDAYAYTGKEWVYVREVEAPKTPGIVGPASVGGATVAGPPRSRGGGFLRALAIGIAAIVGVVVVASVVAALTDEGSPAGTASEATPSGPAAVETSTPTQEPSPSTKAPNPKAKYAARMQRRGWVKAGEGLWLYKDFSCTYDGYSSKVTGIMATSPGVSKRYVSISFGLYDRSGALLGTAIANVNNLAEGTKWKFEAFGVTGSFARCKVADVTAW